MFSTVGSNHCCLLHFVSEVIEKCDKFKTHWSNWLKVLHYAKRVNLHLSLPFLSLICVSVLAWQSNPQCIKVPSTAFCSMALLFTDTQMLLLIFSSSSKHAKVQRNIISDRKLKQTGFTCWVINYMKLLLWSPEWKSQVWKRRPVIGVFRSPSSCWQADSTGHLFSTAVKTEACMQPKWPQQHQQSVISPEAQTNNTATYKCLTPRTSEIMSISTIGARWAGEDSGLTVWHFSCGKHWGL